MGCFLRRAGLGKVLLAGTVGALESREGVPRWGLEAEVPNFSFSVSPAAPDFRGLKLCCDETFFFSAVVVIPENPGATPVRTPSCLHSAAPVRAWPHRCVAIPMKIDSGSVATDAVALPAQQEKKKMRKWWRTGPDLELWLR